MRAQYGKQARFYSISRSHATSDTLEIVVNLASLQGDERVLDVATGTGFCAMAFAPKVREVVAYDLTPEMLAEAERLSTGRGIDNVRFQQGAAESMPFEDGAFNIVTVRTAPHHFASVDQFAAEAFRVLRPGGLFLIADTSAPADVQADAWQNEVEVLRDPSHIRDYTMAEWRRFVETAGFSVEEVIQHNWTELTFADWVLRSGTPPDTVQRLRRLFEQAPASAMEAFAIERDGDDWRWTWPVIVLKAVKPA